MHAHVVDGNSQLLGGDLRKNRRAALPNLDSSREYGYFAPGIDPNCRGRCRWRPRRFGDACETFAHPSSPRLVRQVAFFTPADRLCRLEKSLFQSDGDEAFAPIRKVSVYKNILQTEIERIHSKPGSQLVHVLFARPGRLRNPVSTECAGQWLVGVNSVAVYFDVRDTIRPGRRQTSFHANRWTLLCVRARSPVNPDLTRDERAVPLDAALDIHDRFVACDGRNECFRPIELHSNRPAVRVVREGDRDGFHFHGALGTEAATLIGIYESNLFFR